MQLPKTEGVSPRIVRRMAPWTVGLTLVALLVGVLPTFAAQGDTAAEAIAIGTGGRFSGTVQPQKSLWFKLMYAGENQEATFEVDYAPGDAHRFDFQLYTGTSGDLRKEEATPTRTNNYLVQTFRDSSARDVFIEFKNSHEDRTVSFVGTVGAIVAPPAVTITPTPSPNAPSAVEAVVIPASGRTSGVVLPRRANWSKFWYGNPGSTTTVSATFGVDELSTVELDLYTQNGTAAPQKQDGSSTLSDRVRTRTITLSEAQFVYAVVRNENDAAEVSYGILVNPAFAPPTTPTATATAAVTATSVATATPTAFPTPQPAPALTRDERYFPETRFRIDDQRIWDYFQARGRLETFGYPVSRTFTFLGCQVQVFQRQVAQRCGDNVSLMNLLDPDLFPYTKVNGSTFPGPDDSLKNSTPRVDSPTYATAILDFVRANAPDTFDGQPVGFGNTFFSSITPQQAGTDNPGILGLFDLEVWGAPISRPQRDPNNGNFIYQRFQRGIMHYTAGQGTRGILLADYLKQIILGPSRAPALPGDLADQARGSKYFAQYCPGASGWLCRPGELPGTNLEFAFEQG